MKCFACGTEPTGEPWTCECGGTRLPPSSGAWVQFAERCNVLEGLLRQCWDAGDFLAQMAQDFKKAAKAQHDCPNIAHCRGYVESGGDLVTAIARWKEASNVTHERLAKGDGE